MRSPPCAAFRYRGRGLLGHVAPACGLCSGTLRAAGLAALLLYLAGDPLAKHGDTWKLLVLTAVFYTLLKSLVVLVRSHDSQLGEQLHLFLFCFVSVSNFLTVC